MKSEKLKMMNEEWSSKCKISKEMEYLDWVSSLYNSKKISGNVPNCRRFFYIILKVLLTFLQR